MGSEGGEGQKEQMENEQGTWPLSQRSHILFGESDIQGPHPCADILGPWQDSAAGLLGFLYIRQMSCAQATTQSHGPH